jgi:hypothetical protein
MDVSSPKHGFLGADSSSLDAAIQLPIASVIVVNYNCGAYLGQAVELILGQTYPNVERIVMDNAGLYLSHGQTQYFYTTCGIE